MMDNKGTEWHVSLQFDQGLQANSYNPILAFIVHKWSDSCVHK